jgi:serine/threonine protein kinase
MTQHIDDSPTVALLDNRYELRERVGEGGMALVYRAEDTVLGRTVAIKLLKDDAEVLAAPVRAHREVAALARLNHRALVSLFDAKLAPGAPRYLVLEYVEGPTLSRVLQRGPLPIAQVAELAHQLSSGLGAVHAAGLIHRDVKPSNILLSPALPPSGGVNVKLADFGLAQLADAASVTTPGMVLGTAAYIAPEQVRGEPCVPASDVYALGLVLLEALSGERAFGNTSGIGQVMARITASPAIPADIDPGWADLLRRMTQSDPAMRPTALEVAETVRRLPSSRAGRTPAGSGEPATPARSRPNVLDTIPAPVSAFAHRATDETPRLVPEPAHAAA